MPFLGPVAVAFVGVLAVAGFAVWQLEETDRDADARVEALADAYDAATADAPPEVPSAEEIVDGDEPAPTPSDLAPVATADTVTVGPTPAQVAAAVAASCANGACSVPVTAEQVQAALVVFCSTGACTPPPAAPGVDGADGQDGTDGVPGPTPSPADLDAAVARYCATVDCTGAAGPPGPAPVSITLDNGQVCTDPEGDLTYTCTGGGLLDGLVP